MLVAHAAYHGWAPQLATLTRLHSHHGVTLLQNLLGPFSVMVALAAMPCTWLRPAVTRCTSGWSQAADKRCMWACRLWAASDLQHIKTIEVGKAWVTDCLYLPSARRLVCTSADRAVRRQDAPAAWNVDCAQTLRSSKGSGLYCSCDVPS